MCRIIFYNFTTYPKYPNPCVEGDVHCSRCNIVLIKLKYGPKCKHQHSGWANPQQNGSDFFLIDSYNIYIYTVYIFIHTHVEFDQIIDCLPILSLFTGHPHVGWLCLQVLGMDTLRFQTPTCWKSLHLRMIFSLKPPFIVDCPAKAMISVPYTRPGKHTKSELENHHIS